MLDSFQARRGLFRAVKWGKAVSGGCELAMKLAMKKSHTANLILDYDPEIGEGRVEIVMMDRFQTLIISITAVAARCGLNRNLVVNPRN